MTFRGDGGGRSGQVPIPRLRRRKPIGAAPGTLVADPAAARPVISVIAYGPVGLEERSVESVDELEDLDGAHPVLWVNVDGLGDPDVIESIGSVFGLHRLALEDVINVHQRAKVEEYEDHAFIVTRMIRSAGEPAGEQVSMFLGEGYLLTFQERAGDSFDPVRERLRRGRGQIRERGADYLAYALLEAMVDGCFPVLEAIGERLEALEAAVLSSGDEQVVADIHHMKRELLTMRRGIWPQREMLSALTRESIEAIRPPTQLYLRNCYDHVIQLMDLLEIYREIASGLVDVYLSQASARLNEVMKLLTMIATIFIPLSFIAGIYGMNFDPQASPWNMPELEWHFGYFFALGLMLVTGLSLLFVFYRRGWIGRRMRKRRRSGQHDATRQPPGG